jgi:hypothetical protein
MYFSLGFKSSALRNTHLCPPAPLGEFSRGALELWCIAGDPGSYLCTPPSASCVHFHRPESPSWAPWVPWCGPASSMSYWEESSCGLYLCIFVLRLGGPGLRPLQPEVFPAAGQSLLHCVIRKNYHQVAALCLPAALLTSQKLVLTFTPGGLILLPTPLTHRLLGFVHLKALLSLSPCQPSEHREAGILRARLVSPLPSVLVLSCLLPNVRPGPTLPSSLPSQLPPPRSFC